MPILRIEALPQKPKVDIQRALRRVCVELSKIYECKPEQVWATWRPIESGFFVEGENAAEFQQDGTHPPIANLICFEGKPPETIARMLEVGSKVLSEELGIPGNIFMYYTEARSGQVFTGGSVRVRK
jgi:hypothetical protein